MTDAIKEKARDLRGHLETMDGEKWRPAYRKQVDTLIENTLRETRNEAGSGLRNAVALNADTAHAVRYQIKRRARQEKRPMSPGERSARRDLKAIADSLRDALKSDTDK